jgi:hypothetical protein
VTAPAEPPYFDLAPAWAREMYKAIIEQGSSIMAQVKVEQDDLNQIQTDLGNIADDLERELTALNVPAGDLKGVRAVVDRLRTDVAVPTPAPEPTPE